MDDKKVANENLLKPFHRKYNLIVIHKFQHSWVDVTKKG